ncbi:MAG: hypothetical protein IIA19_06670 [Thaumarchaeota archaeon]|nr:hypothetical protein [Nitrososphaerota archaeon]
MDEKEEDRSEESLRKHLIFYKKLNKTISDIQTEIQTFTDEKVLKHLNDRIEAMELDKTRIRKMFPEVNIETWKDLN